MSVLRHRETELKTGKRTWRLTHGLQRSRDGGVALADAAR